MLLLNEIQTLKMLSSVRLRVGKDLISVNSARKLNEMDVNRFISHAETLADEGESQLCVQILNVLQDILDVEHREIETEDVS